MLQGLGEFDSALWKQRLREGQLRVTGGRLAVLRTLLSSGGPMSHSELVSELEDETYDRATLFRILNDLTQAGLVEKKDLGDHTWRFEIRSENSGRKASQHQIEHPHFTCTDCGEVKCLPEASVGLRPGSGVPRAVSSKKVQVTLQGVCDSCD